ncbi:MAG TPA: glycoside hydrolase family 3 N-terminal domain-containing protein [Thermoanaerobaculia bacterium]|jgi:beta-glucosidase|nr:glycoside hydrolase family 3 N-terminal domain-containing protein [Thermoanaerobaculia bacterium]
MREKFLVTLAVLFFTTSLAAQRAGVDERVERLLRRMTLQEKLGQLLQYTPSQPDIRELVASGGVGCAFNFGGAAETNALQRVAVEESRLKIPLLFAHDVIHGFRTIFPIPLGIASTWDPSAAELAARIAAREASASGIRWTFAPMVDIARDPRWGRVAEGAGEDPYLGAAMAVAYVRGFQGKDVSAPDSILACAKHFAAYGAAEAGRDYNSVDMSERMLREVYLPPFKAAVDAGVWTIMTAFDALNGVPATANRYLLKTILRDEWRFRGFVDSDYQAIAQLIDHGVAATLQEAALKAITAGVDMDMVDGCYADLDAAVKDGRLSESVIDASVRRILRAKFALGLFERPYADEQREKAIMFAKEHVDAARRIAQKSIVLLKNEGALLPLSKSAGTIAVIGPLADSKADMLGCWTAHGKPEEAVTVLEGVRAKAQVVYAKGCGVRDGTEEEMAEAVNVAAKSDVVLLIVGEEGNMTGEASSRTSLDLPGKQQQLVEAIVATGKPVILVVMSGRPLTITWAAAHVPAIVWPWFPGSQAGHAIADVLFGDVNPGGKLPISIPRSVGQIPIYYAHLPTGRPEDPANKYTSKYIDSPNDPLYPFGHGLSYTRFEYSDLRVSGTFKVSADVRNAGERAGDEIVQLYVRQTVASASRPVKELKGFQRVTLAAGEKRRIEFTIAPNDLRFWSDRGWKTEPGTFKVWIGPSSAEGLEGIFELK